MNISKRSNGQQQENRKGILFRLAVLLFVMGMAGAAAAQNCQPVCYTCDYDDEYIGGQVSQEDPLTGYICSIGPCQPFTC